MVDGISSRLGDCSVLVTGGAGFIGSHITDRLPETCSVRVFDSLTAGTRNHVPNGVDFIEGDIRNKADVQEAMQDIDVVFHQAAQVSVQKSVQVPPTSHDINVTGTLNILELARRYDVTVVFASSTAIYGEPNSVPISENDPKNPTSPYGLDKLTADHYVRLYHELYDLDTIALRYFNVYGPRQRGGQYGGVIRIFIDQALSGGPLTVHGDGTQTRDFVHVTDIVKANIIAATADHFGTSYNIGTGEEVSILEVAELIQELVSEDIDIIHEKERPGDINKSCADITKVETQLNFTPSVVLEEGITDLIEYRA